jgi:N-acyl-D-amino-acid deacylase
VSNVAPFSADIAIRGARIRDTATYHDPHQIAEGMVRVVVNGEPAVRDGEFTGNRAGVVLTPHE